MLANPIFAQPRAGHLLTGDALPATVGSSRFSWLKQDEIFERTAVAVGASVLPEIR